MAYYRSFAQVCTLCLFFAAQSVVGSASASGTSISIGFQQDRPANDPSPLTTSRDTPIEPTVTVLTDVKKSDDNAIAMLSLSDGGFMSHCASSGTTYLTIHGAAGNMSNVIAKTPSAYQNVTSPQEMPIQFASHGAIEGVFPTTAVLFTNESCTSNVTSFRLYTLMVSDLVSRSDTESLIYRVEVLNVTQTIGMEPTQSIPKEVVLEQPMRFSSGTMMMDLIDVDDESVPEEIRIYTLAHMSRTGELAYNADKFARKVEAGDDMVNAQGVLTLWLLGPLSIPLYPAFITCCAFSLLIWYTIQPFVFCCII